MVKTVRVRIAVAVSWDGVAAAYGWTGARLYNTDEALEAMSIEVLEDICNARVNAIHFIEADVPVPEKPKPTTIKGEVVS